MPTTTLPGGGSTKYVLPVGADAKAVLASAIKSQFKAAGKHITINKVASKASGKTGFFNAVISDKSGAKLTAGKGVQAIFDLGKGHETLIGGTKTTLIYANESNTKGDSIVATGKGMIFGTAGADTVSLSNGNFTAYLEGGKNVVKLSGADTIHTGSGSYSIAGGSSKLTFIHGKGSKDTVSVTKNKGTDKFTGAGSDKKGSDLFAISKSAGGKFVITSFSSKDKLKIVGATSKEITKALKGAHHTVHGGVTTTTLTIGSDKITVSGVAITHKNFGH